MTNGRHAVFGRVWATLRRFRLEVLALSGVAALGLGWWGFARSAHANGAEESVRTHLYNALGLFGLENGAVPDPVPWQLDIARFLAPATALAAAIAAFAVVFDQRVQRLLARYVLRDHVLVVGAGGRAAEVAHGFATIGRRVALLAFEDDGVHHRSLRRAGITVVRADAGDADTPIEELRDALRDAGSGRAATALILSGDDERNARIASGLTGDHQRPAQVLIEIDEMNALHAVGTRAAGQPHNVEAFSVAERSARALVDSLHQVLREGTGDEPTTVVVAGSTPFAHHVVVHLARSWALDQERATGQALPRPRVLIDRGADRDPTVDYTHLQEHFARWDPRLAGRTPACDIQPLDEAPRSIAAAAVVIADDDPAATLAAALDWATAGTARQVVACPAHPGGLVDLSIGLAGVDVEVFCREHAILDPEYLLRGFAEDLAMALHWSYRRQREPGSPLDVAWHLLEPAAQRLNRAVAERLLRALHESGVSIRSVDGGDVRPEALSDALRERLAREYHEAWRDDRLAAGWRLGPERDDDGRVHPGLVPWGELAEPEKDFNRNQASALSEVFALLGRRLVVTP